MGEANGMAEERGYGEPIRQTTDNCRFCRRDHKTCHKTRHVDELHGQEDKNGHEQQAAGQAPVATQRASLCLVIAFQLEHDRRRKNFPADFSSDGETFVRCTAMGTEGAANEAPA